MIEKIEKFKKGYVAVVFIATLLFGGVWRIFTTYQEISDKYDNLLETIKTTQQMALKSVIWNEGIPTLERASACDIYLNAGYNSMTKKECEIIIKKGAEQGIFSYVKKEIDKK